MIPWSQSHDKRRLDDSTAAAIFRGRNLLQPMTAHFRHITGVALALMLVGLASGCASADSTAEETGDQAALAKGAATLRASSEFDLDSYQGKVVVVNFWATWCGPCRMEIPSLVRLRDSFDSKQVAVVGVSMDARPTPRETEALVKEFAENFEINYPLYLDSKHELAMRLDKLAHFLPAIPATLIFDQTGVLRSSHRGVPRDRRGRLDPYSALGEEIQELLDGV